MDFLYSSVVFIYFNAFTYTSQSYKQSKLEGYEICAAKPLKQFFDFISKPKYTLGSNTDSAAIITQVWNSTSISRLKTHCSFTVTSHDKLAEFLVVVTKLKFRKRENNCIDYIQFRNGKSPSGEKICADISTASIPIFDRRFGEFKIDVHIDKTLPITDPLEMSMVITSLRSCDSLYDFQCEPENRFSCILRSFVNDKIINCAPPCRDEGECPFDAVTKQVVDASSIALTAITSLVFTMIAVGVCFWFTWKYQKFFRCVIYTRNGERTTNEPPIELPQPPTNNLRVPNGESVPRASCSVDLPPSYESLFPDK